MTKYLAIAVLLLVGVSLGLSQGYTTARAPVVQYIQLNDSIAVGAYYAASQADTTVGYSLSGYADAYLVFKSADSISAVIKYLPSYDGTNFDDAAITMDSVSTQGDGASAANGIMYSIQIPKAAMGYPGVKFFIVFNSWGNGVTTPTYDAKLVLR